MTMEITSGLVRELLHYNPGTGVFTWRVRDRRWFSSLRSCRSWNGKHAGRRAGSIWTNYQSGYRLRVIGMLGRTKSEHQIAWLWMVDDPLPEAIDHENRDGTDNRWCNLRASSSSSNSRNMSMPRNNTSGITGVVWHKNAWQAQCKENSSYRYLGRFKEIDEAAMAVLEFRHDHNFDPKHGIEMAKYHREATL